ncbi:tellurite resistance/C4-dicarboxylate transporter family protein [Edaphobacillus lindanitolerans]|uniref:Tellurite resistance protein TehA n=1 Tax=Edaphobacillus lindanitolerans TaxID=550447 RepID=A0A1U7PTR8_9BACI|nr:tellurite resistance/C4-dicarboxylate transporter family protein [Edaphobacillus lindanitolerans]SIT93057.1 Tellurite resistance protein TehA [Edaphobacillus lindanitolerans]
MLEFIKRQTEYLFTGYFAVVMATGALSISAHLLGYGRLSAALLAVNAVLFILLWVLTGARLVFHPRRMAADIGNHMSGPGFFTIVAGTAVFGSELIVITGRTGPSAFLYGLAALLWVLIMYAFFTAVIVREEKPDLPSGIGGAWLIAAVATQSLSILGVLLSGHSPAPRNWVFASLCMFYLGFMLYLLIIIPIFHRLVFAKLRPRQFAPTYWISMGAAAITTLAGSMLITETDGGDLTAGMMPFLKGLTLMAWTFATWWIPLLASLAGWRYFIKRDPITYDPQFWGMAFPLAMYTAATYQLAGAVDMPDLRVLSRWFFPVSITAWALFFLWMCRHLIGMLIRSRDR